MKDSWFTNLRRQNRPLKEAKMNLSPVPDSLVQTHNQRDCLLNTEDIWPEEEAYRTASQKLLDTTSEDESNNENIPIPEKNKTEGDTKGPMSRSETDPSFSSEKERKIEPVDDRIDETLTKIVSEDSMSQSNKCPSLSPRKKRKLESVNCSLDKAETEFIAEESITRWAFEPTFAPWEERKVKPPESREEKIEADIADLKNKIYEKDRVLRKLSETLREHWKSSLDEVEVTPEGEVVRLTIKNWGKDSVLHKLSGIIKGFWEEFHSRYENTDESD